MRKLLLAALIAALLGGCGLIYKVDVYQGSLLAAAERTEEIARMLGGIELTKETRAHAKQMLARAAKD